jgi:hypothetical protein
MGRTRLLTGEDAEIGSVQDGAQPSSQNKDLSPKGCPEISFLACNDSVRIGTGRSFPQPDRDNYRKEPTGRIYRF